MHSAVAASRGRSPRGYQSRDVRGGAGSDAQCDFVARLHRRCSTPEYSRGPPPSAAVHVTEVPPLVRQDRLTAPRALGTAGCDDAGELLTELPVVAPVVGLVQNAAAVH
jgi:hypothetical protein